MNRSLAIKAERARKERVLRGINSSLDHLAKRPKSVLREISAIAATMQPSRVARLTVVTREVETVLYNPRQPQRRLPTMWAACVPCNGELIKKSAK